MAKRDIDKPEVKPVVSGKVTKKSKGLLNGFIQEDAKTIASSIKEDIIVPTLKDVIFNTFKTSIEMLLWGESNSGYTSHNRRSSGNTNYNNMYTNRQVTNRRQGSPRSRYEVAVVEFEQHLDAELVLESLEDQIDKYGCFSIADYYKASRQPYDYTDENYGWTDMRGIQIVHLRGGGWTIDFPKATPLED